MDFAMSTSVTQYESEKPYRTALSVALCEGEEETKSLKRPPENGFSILISKLLAFFGCVVVRSLE